MFDAVANELDFKVDELVHIGDRDSNDVKGPQALGAKAVLYTGSRPDEKDNTTADAICENHHDLPKIIDKLAAQ